MGEEDEDGLVVWQWLRHVQGARAGRATRAVRLVCAEHVEETYWDDCVLLGSVRPICVLRAIKLLAVFPRKARAVLYCHDITYW